jgi:hypothetical protein
MDVLAPVRDREGTLADILDAARFGSSLGLTPAEEVPPGPVERLMNLSPRLELL